ncbi:MAG: Flp family type IVb pilin [Robiginitomaculum sp.]|nr:Flp family type IVb pilin [Robiginitomaculum sp.]
MRSKMNKTQNLLRRYFSSEEGATAIEYALLVALLSVALISAMSLLASTQSTMWNNVSNTLNNANP